MTNFNVGDLGYLVPYLILAIAGMLVVMAEAFFKGQDRSALSGLTVVGAAASAVASIVMVRQLGADERHSLLGGMLVADRMSYVLSAVFAATTAATALISPAHQREHGWQSGEYYGVMLLSASGMVMLAHASDLCTVFLGVETMSIGVYVMTGLRRRSKRGNEAALKYFLMGAFATGFLLYGMALLYGAAGTTSRSCTTGRPCRRSRFSTCSAGSPGRRPSVAAASSSSRAGTCGLPARRSSTLRISAIRVSLGSSGRRCA